MVERFSVGDRARFAYLDPDPRGDWVRFSDYERVEGERDLEKTLREDAYRYQQAAEDLLNPEQKRVAELEAAFDALDAAIHAHNRDVYETAIAKRRCQVDIDRDLHRAWFKVRKDLGLPRSPERPDPRPERPFDHHGHAHNRLLADEREKHKTELDAVREHYLRSVNQAYEQGLKVHYEEMGPPGFELIPIRNCQGTKEIPTPQGNRRCHGCPDCQPPAPEASEWPEVVVEQVASRRYEAANHTRGWRWTDTHEDVRAIWLGEACKRLDALLADETRRDLKEACMKAAARESDTHKRLTEPGRSELEIAEGLEANGRKQAYLDVVWRLGKLEQVGGSE